MHLSFPPIRATYPDHLLDWIRYDTQAADILHVKDVYVGSLRSNFGSIYVMKKSLCTLKMDIGWSESRGEPTALRVQISVESDPSPRGYVTRGHVCHLQCIICGYSSTV